MDQPRSGAAVRPVHAQRRRRSAIPAAPRACAGWSTGSPTRFRDNDKAGARRNIAHHYDLGNDFYAAWLDPGMTYSSAIFAEPIARCEPLEAAQERKIRLLLDRLDAEARPAPARDRLRLGRARRDRGARLWRPGHRPHPVRGAEGLCRAAGSPARASPSAAGSSSPTIATSPARYDAVASVEMVEAVGQEYWPAYLESIARVLKPGGRAALQLISIRERPVRELCGQCRFHPDLYLSRRDADRRGAASRADRRGGRPRLAGPPGLRPPLCRDAEALARAATSAAVAEERLPAGFDDAFHQLWRYYLMYCEGGFRGGGIDVAQVTLGEGGYPPCAQAWRGTTRSGGGGAHPHVHPSHHACGVVPLPMRFAHRED